MNQTLFENITVELAGETIKPKRALVLVHGRGASAASIMQLTQHLTLPLDTLVVAPEAPGHQWYPRRFIVPQQENEPELGNALGAIDTIVRGLEAQFGLSTEQIFLAGFSQGACLVSEYIKQNPQQYLGAAVMSGGLIGTDKEVTNNYGVGSLSGTPIYLGCDTQDFHIPIERVIVTEKVLSDLSAQVDMQHYEGLGHTIHPNALKFIEQHL